MTNQDNEKWMTVFENEEEARYFFKKALGYDKLVELVRETINTLWAVGANSLGQSYPSAEDVSKALVPTCLADIFNDSRNLLKELGESVPVIAVIRRFK